MKIITTKAGIQVVVDDTDYEVLKNYKLYFHRSWRRVILYFQGKQIALSRFLMSPPIDMVVDHINSNVLDNRRCNLRICTARQNSYNKSKRKARSSSSYKGVTLMKSKFKQRHRGSRKSYHASIVYNGKRIELGCYEDEIQAAWVYDQAAKKYFGEYAKLNFNS